MDVDDAPLAGVRVVEISQYVQGPVAGLTLACLGADVVKIEQVGRRDAFGRLIRRPPAWPTHGGGEFGFRGDIAADPCQG